jgi:hypothetical protein
MWGVSTMSSKYAGFLCTIAAPTAVCPSKLQRGTSGAFVNATITWKKFLPPESGVSLPE